MSTGQRWYWFLLQLAAIAAGVVAGVSLFDVITG